MKAKNYFIVMAALVLAVSCGQRNASKNSPAELTSEEQGVVSTVDSLELKYAPKIEIGTPVEDFTVKTSDGEDFTFSSLKGNYVVLDFWASWCGPCRFDLPYVKEAYDKYHSRGLEIVGVSFDDDAEKWKNAIAEEGLPWIHISDLKGWGCAASKIYGINAIPFSILVDRNGIIVARDLRMTQLMEKLDELYASEQ